jgi:hypothetical protein
MAKIEGTTRKIYTREMVRKLKDKLSKVTPKKETITFESLQNRLGNLQAAGHMKIDGFQTLNIDADINESGTYKTHNITFKTYIEDGMNDKPHVTGYLTSVHSGDKGYRLKGWFNEDGVLRLEIVC